MTDRNQHEHRHETRRANGANRGGLGRRRHVFAARALPLAILFAWPGCAEQLRDPVLFGLSVRGHPDAARFTNAQGFEVQLTSVGLGLGPVRMHGGEAGDTDGDHIEQTARWIDGLVSPSAWAHAGDDAVDESLVAEALHQVVVDLLAAGPGSSPIEVRGFAERVEDVDAILDLPSESIVGDAETLGGATISVVGEATRGGETFPFAGTLGFETAREVHVHAASFVARDRALFVITVDPRPWFEEARFDELTRLDDDGRLVIDDDSQVGRQWRLDLDAEGVFEGRLDAAP